MNTTLALDKPFRPPGPADYLTEHTAGSIIRCTFQIFFRNFVPLFLIFFVPLFPFVLLLVHGLHDPWNPAMVAIGFIGFWVALFFAVSATTVAVSDICVGNRPDVARAYRRVFGETGVRVLGTLLLVSPLVVLVFAVAVFVGVVGTLLIAALGSVGLLLAWRELLLFPIVALAVLLAMALSMLLLTWYMFWCQVVVLEPAWGIAALRRSRRLGRGHYVRNLVILVFCATVINVPVLTGVIAGYVAFFRLGASESADIMMALGPLLFGPLSAIAPVLLYYDMRVRHEAYDMNGLVADLTI